MQRSTTSSKRIARLGRSRSPGSVPARERSVSIIGAGRVGTALGLALKAKGYEIEVVVNKRPAAARRAARTFGPKTLALSALQLNRLNASQYDRLNRGSLVIIATPDDVIAATAEQLAAIFRSKLTGSIRPKGVSAVGRIVLHTSGALSADVLAPLRGAGFAVGSLHPLVSISDSRSGAELLTRAFFSVEGEPAAVRAAKSAVRRLGGQSFTIDSDRKALYHAAAVTAAPNMTALFDIALEILGRCGLSRLRARQVLLPLVESTLKNLETQDPARALTGTFKRGDVSTVQKHLAALKAENLPQALAAYVLLGQRSLSLAREGKANSAGLDQIARMLGKAFKPPSR
jgi:predicted short-subunit dehydrogenase-like oxidoreductase (DUF2520 family)